MAGTPASVNGREDSHTNPAYAPTGRDRASFPLGQVLGSHEGHIKWPSARAELAINLMPRPSGATRELRLRYRARHSEKSVQQNGDADRNVSMVSTARTGPLGGTVHFCEYSASQGGCIRAETTFWFHRRLRRAVYASRQAPLEPNWRVSRHTERQNSVDSRNATRPQRCRQGLRC